MAQPTIEAGAPSRRLAQYYSCISRSCACAAAGSQLVAPRAHGRERRAGAERGAVHNDRSVGRGRCNRSGRFSDRARLSADTRAQFGQTVSARAPDSLNLTRSISSRSRQFGQLSSNTSLPVIAPLHKQERRLVGEATSGWIGSLSVPDGIFAQRFAIRKSAFPARMPSGDVLRGGDG
jgi:hypothetical protein